MQIPIGAGAALKGGSACHQSTNKGKRHNRAGQKVISLRGMESANVERQTLEAVLWLVVLRILSVLMVGDRPTGTTRPFGDGVLPAIAVADRRYKRS
jgi:hypothetical protein